MALASSRGVAAGPLRGVVTSCGVPRSAWGTSQLARHAGVMRRLLVPPLRASTLLRRTLVMSRPHLARTLATRTTGRTAMPLHVMPQLRCWRPQPRSVATTTVLHCRLASSSQSAPSPRSSAGGGRRGGESAGASTASSQERNRSLLLYAVSVIVGALGLSYASVPLYQAFCKATGYGGTVRKADEEQFLTMRPVEDAAPITVTFNADTGDEMPWKFVPQQRSVKVKPGETALAFYTATNPTNKPITGVSTYNVTPMRAGVYFTKIQCFCFEEQRLRPGESVDMPLLFFIEPEILEDPAMTGIKTLTLSYTFFKTGEEAPRETASQDGAGGIERGVPKGPNGETADEWAQTMVNRLNVRKVPDSMARRGIKGLGSGDRDGDGGGDAPASK